MSNERAAEIINSFIAYFDGVIRDENNTIESRENAKEDKEAFEMAVRALMNQIQKH